MLSMYSDDLRRWYSVDKLSLSHTQERLLRERGIYIGRSNLQRWIQHPARRLERLDDNESVHSHACGASALERLQCGAEPLKVAEDILRLYLAEVTVSRLIAYRLYREQEPVYWIPGGLCGAYVLYIADSECF